ncbi:MAG: hypothetical protein SGI88_20245 [Candidatus Hydrogenedentes bacterium]|nr:hypothetical protein [Candidatus Hydrogenedentota bacterium]
MPETTVYEYTGYLRTVLDAPNAAIRDSLDHIEFSADDLAQWPTKDFENEKEWKRIPVMRARTEEGVKLTGRFEEVRRMDSIPRDDPSFWVSLSTIDWKDDRFPIDVQRFPIAEITYRCTSENAHPFWVWKYPGGRYVDRLPRTRQWRTLSRRITHWGIPQHIDTFIIRLYSTMRSTESIEITSLRFRAMSQEEQDACERDRVQLSEDHPVRVYPILDEFMPLGTCMNADTVRRCSELLGISLGEYWWLAMEDLVSHHHNCVHIENVERMSREEWREMLSYAERYGVKIVPSLNLPVRDDPQETRELIDTLVKPLAHSSTVLAWNLRREPPEDDFRGLLQAKKWVEEIDSIHPVAVLTRHPSAYPLYAPYFPVSGMSHFVSHASWEVGEMVRTHAPLAGGQQFWLLGPAFMFATGTPEWSTCPEMRLMINVAFLNGARGWFSYAYHNDPIWLSGSFQRSLTGPFLMFSDLWLELDRRMEAYNAIAPLLLHAHPARLPKEWFVESRSSDDFAKLPPGMDSTSSFRLRGNDFNLFCVASNDVRGMSSLNINIPPASLMPGQEMIDLTDFVLNRTWQPMNLSRHIEMFPGQAQIVLMADRSVCEHWRDVLAQRLVEDDRKQLTFNLALAQTYGLDTAPIEVLFQRSVNGAPMQNLAAMDEAYDKLIDLMYAAPQIRDTRSRIIEASSGICACDGALCRLIGKGKSDLAKEWGLKVIPLAREITHLRLELRRGKGGEILEFAEDVAKRTLELLKEIRALT